MEEIRNAVYDRISESFPGRSAESVSYTHLDVYKRQRVWLALFPAADAPETIRKADGRDLRRRRMGTVAYAA